MITLPGTFWQWLDANNAPREALLTTQWPIDHEVSICIRLFIAECGLPLNQVVSFNNIGNNTIFRLYPILDGLVSKDGACHFSHGTIIVIPIPLQNNPFQNKAVVIRATIQKIYAISDSGELLFAVAILW